MFEQLRNCTKISLLRILPQKAQQVIKDLRALRRAPSDIVTGTQQGVEDALSSMLGPPYINHLLNDRRKHLGSIARSGGVTVVEISDERPAEHLSPIKPEKIRALAATSNITGIKIPGGLRLTFTPHSPQR
mgnify:CR=1 FL=1